MILIDLDLHSRSQGCEKAKSAVLIIVQNSLLILMEFFMLLGLVDVVNLIFILSWLISIQGRTPSSSDFVKKNP